MLKFLCGVKYFEKSFSSNWLLKLTRSEFNRGRTARSAVHRTSNNSNISLNCELAS